MDRTIVAIGGGELKSKETASIDRFLCEEAKKRVGDRRAVALFVGTASRDCMPYYNTFHKTYTGDNGLKTDVALLSRGVADEEKLKKKFETADLIYVGGGDTVYMLSKWKETGVTESILAAYRRGAILCGLSAGAICWFREMYTDSKTDAGEDTPYGYENALGILSGGACPHFDERKEDFLLSVGQGVHENIFYCIGNRSALVFRNETFEKAIGEGKSFLYERGNNALKELC